MQCPRCYCHYEPIFLFKIDPKTHRHFYIKCCPRVECSWNYDIYTAAEYHEMRRKGKTDLPDKRRDDGPTDSRWMFGI
jgi:hypothetical protein